MFNFLDRYAFEEFPRRPLTFHVSRRRFVPAILESLHVSTLEMQGVPSRNLSAMGEMPDEQLAGVIPQVISGTVISMKEGYVLATLAQTGQNLRLFPAREPILYAFNLFNGMNTLSEASRQLSRQTGWEVQHSFAYARGLFLYLVVGQICRPRDA